MHHRSGNRDGLRGHRNDDNDDNYNSGNGNVNKHYYDGHRGSHGRGGSHGSHAVRADKLFKVAIGAALFCTMSVCFIHSQFVVGPYFDACYSFKFVVENNFDSKESINGGPGIVVYEPARKAPWQTSTVYEPARKAPWQTSTVETAADTIAANAADAAADEDAAWENAAAAGAALGDGDLKLTICAWVNNEGPYLAEWIEHHASIGFDSILLFNHESTDETQCVMDAYAEKGLVVRIPEDIDPIHLKGKTTFVHQAQVFDTCRSYLLDVENREGKPDTTWMATLDTDEFLWIDRTGGGGMNTAKDAVRMMLRDLPFTRSVRVPHFMYGSSGQDTYRRDGKEDFVMKRFVHRYNPDPNLTVAMPHKKSSRLPLTSCGGVLEGEFPYALEPKAMSLLSATGTDCNPDSEGMTYCVKVHCHRLAVRDAVDAAVAAVDKRVLYVPNDVRKYFALAHYKLKSRQEFYDRVCTSSYFDKYYLPPPIKAAYEGCCSPKSFVDDFDREASFLDDRMLPFAEDLRKNFTDASSHCFAADDDDENSPPKYETPCTNEVMGLSGAAGAEAMRLFPDDGKMLKPMLNQNFRTGRRPLIFGSGFGTTGTHGLFEATCALGLRSVHYFLECGFLIQPVSKASTELVVSNGLLAHERALRAHLAVEACIDVERIQRDDPTVSEALCPTVSETLSAMKSHIDDVIFSLDVEVIHDTPYPEYADYVLETAERIRRSKPVVLLSERDPYQWAARRVSRGFGYNCKIPDGVDSGDLEFNSDGESDSSPTPGFSPEGSRLYRCLSAAVRNGHGDRPIFDVLTGRHREKHSHMRNFSPEGVARTEAMSTGLRNHQDSMRTIADYQVDLFNRIEKTDTEALGGEIQSAMSRKLNRSFLEPNLNASHSPSFTSEFQKKFRHHWYQQPGRTCMPSYKSAVKSGRFCDKLVVFLHFHKASGSSMIEYLNLRGLRSSLFSKIKDGSDMTVAPLNKDNLRLHSSAPVSRASGADFWRSVYTRGVDVLNLEYNFMTPTQYSEGKSEFWAITMFRKPWDRFRSTYERELLISCRAKRKENGEKDREGQVACFNKRKLEGWMVNKTPVMSKKIFDDMGGMTRREFWAGILHPNYYVRMLNGLGDVPGEELDRSHLDAAKRVVDSFDLILFVEDSEKSKQQHLCEFFGANRMKNREMQCDLPMPSVTNNKLKNDPLYDSIKLESEKMIPLFEKQNKLDIELYRYARKKFSK